jgi:hypothetical protein
MLTITRTLVFRDFQRRLGNCTFHINSAYIGLEWIARGRGKPEDFEINWDAPKKPRESVDQARQLIHSAMLGHVYDALDSYLRLIADIPWSYLSIDQRNVLRKSITRPGGSAYSIADRFTEMHFHLDIDVKGEDYNNAEIDLELLKVLVAWRNQNVHDGLNTSGELRLPDGCEEKLLNAKDKLAARYGDLDPIILLAHMRGWGDAFAYGNSLSTIEDLDRRVDSKLDDFRHWFSKQISGGDWKTRRRLGGVCLISDIPTKSLDDVPFSLEAGNR